MSSLLHLIVICGLFGYCYWLGRESRPTEREVRRKVAAQAWIVPKVEHDPHALVGPRILNSRRIPGTWIYREQGNSDPDHTRTYAAQLLAAADEVDARGEQT